MKSPLLAALLLSAATLRAQPPASLGAETGANVTAAADSVARYNAPEWKLAWADEFDAPGQPDPANWGYEHGLVRNKEAQFYTNARPENARVADGNLIITARKEAWEGAAYTSASLTTEGCREFTYGKIEIRAKVPAGRGTWPAIWTLGADRKTIGWPKCGEIDLMEFVGKSPEKLHFNVHTEAFNHVQHTNKGTAVAIPDAWAGYHTYGLLWTDKKLEWFLDGQPVFAFDNDSQGAAHWPFDKPQYLLLNLAIGGSWGGAAGIDDTIFPVEFRVDYVRVWQKP